MCFTFVISETKKGTIFVVPLKNIHCVYWNCVPNSRHNWSNQLLMLVSPHKAFVYLRSVNSLSMVPMRPAPYLFLLKPLEFLILSISISFAVASATTLILLMILIFWLIFQ